MGESTGIAWTRSTFNPWIGCTKVSPGCDHCYAEQNRAAQRMKIKWGAGEPRHRTGASLWRNPLRWNAVARWEQEHGELHPSWRRDGLEWHKPGFYPVFCASLADVFDNEVLDAWREDLWHLIELTPSLTWLLLTKRIGNASKMLGQWFNVLPNVWLGASIVNQAEADRDIPKLLATPAAKRFLSYEPALGPVDFTVKCPPHYAAHLREDRISWVIVGGESSQGGAKARPFNVFWAYNVLHQCQDAGVAFFMKQMGSTVYWQAEQPLTNIAIHGHAYKDRAGADPAEWPADLRVQEFPV